MMAAQFHQQNYTMLSIIHSPASKYYTLMTDDELESSPIEPKLHPDRLVLRCTPRELQTIRTTTQLNLNLETNNDTPTDTVHDRKLGSDSDPQALP